MASRNAPLIFHPALGGLDITTDATVLAPNFLTEATNVEFLEDGRRAKRLGSIQYAPTSSYAGTVTNKMISTTATGQVNAFNDVWTYGASLTPVQRLVAQVGNSIYRSTGNGLWSAVTTASSWTGSLRTDITLAQDYAVVSGLGGSAPIAYNPTSTTLVSPTTGSAWPTFEHATYHLGRLWMGGISTAPSMVRATADGNIFDSTGA